ncbi:hypothetical protein [Marilutibacter maris]|uniref:hypothetical protein n=1 Tax=Marilutibacter maris TaxID=1605891 RepID=UPI000DA72164|nr:hypothetical protein [Lysobacter maris]
MVSTFVGALLAFSALVVGFIVALMLFTGTVGNMAALSLEQLQAHTARIKYLLVSQTTTLAAALLTTISAIVWLILFSVSAQKLLIDVNSGLIGGFMLITLIRTVLLPLQIFELHAATLADEETIKAQETRNRYTQSQ